MAKLTFRGRTRPFGWQTRRTIRLTRWAMVAERAARAFWPVVTILAFVGAAALFGLFQWLDPLAHRIALALAGLALLGALSVGLFRMRLPDQTEAARRLDRGDRSQPLSTLTDTLAVGRDHGRAETIWHAHLLRAERAAAALRPARPDLNLAPFDTWALRLVALTLLVGAFIGAGAHWSERLWSVAQPGRAEAGAVASYDAEPAAEAWVTPPPYTGRDTVYLTGLAAGAKVPELPERSELTIRVTDFEGTPVLEGGALAGVEDFTSYGGGLAEARAVLHESGTLRVLADGDVLADWTLPVTPDAPPAIALTREPQRAATGALDLGFSTTDDYGVVGAWAEIVPAGGLNPERSLVGEPITFALPLPISGDATEIEDSAMRDLTEHPLAGAEVVMALHAEDGAEQVGRSEEVRFVLPERRFLNPLARALVEQRRALALDFDRGERVLDVLQAVTRLPEEIFDGNTGAYMGTRTAIRRLAYGVFDEQVAAVAPEVTELLWLAAIALEEGDLSDALAQLRQAEQRLREALESGTDQEVAEALEAMRQAMDNYLQQLAQQMMQNPPQPGQQQPQPSQQLSQQDLQEMLDQIQRNAESGLRDQARDMLSELSRMLENLQAGTPQMQQGPGQGSQAMQELQELIQRQRDLADQTFDSLREGQQGQQNGGQTQQGGQPGQSQGQGQQPGQQGEGGEGNQLGPNGQPMPGQQGQGDLAAQQRALREALDGLARQLPGGQGSELQDALRGAGREMGEATDDLDRGANADAVQDQMEALDRLNEGANALAQQMQNGQGDTAATGQGRGDRGLPRDEFDPFDRPSGSNGALDGEDTKVPDRSALDRAREVLEELRRRSAEPHRPELELDYFDRLIEPF
ncbi:MAG TPA: TIGR02302 family protein [Thermohalobaculum sp.]|nr:TIGR02302 family protein [Thermohalobaculum sp.]